MQKLYNTQEEIYTECNYSSFKETSVDLIDEILWYVI